MKEASEEHSRNEKETKKNNLQFVLQIIASNVAFPSICRGPIKRLPTTSLSTSELPDIGGGVGRQGRQIAMRWNILWDSSWIFYCNSKIWLTNITLVYITLSGFKIMPLRNRGIIVTDRRIYSTSIKKSK